MTTAVQQAVKRVQLTRLETNMDKLDKVLEDITSGDWKDSLGTQEEFEEAQRLESLISAWNGSDETFLHDGEVYTEDDVHNAEDRLEDIKNK